MSVGVFYASKGGTAKGFAENIATRLGGDAFNMKDTDVAKLGEYENIVFVSSNYFFGALQEDWGSKVKLLHTIDFSKKRVAIVGVGSQARHPDSFCSGAEDFYNKLQFSGAHFVGAVDAAAYKFSFSRFQRGQKMLGLCLDKDDKDNEAKIDAWTESVKKSFR